MHVLVAAMCGLEFLHCI